MIESILKTTNPIVECVLNISEGRNASIINELVEKLVEEGKVHVLNVDSGFHVNRTVITLIGNLYDLCDHLSLAFKYCSEVLNIELHEGSHPRIGMLDVIPFIPVQNISLNELADFIDSWAEEISTKFHLPIFLYGMLAQNKARQPLHYFRRGELRGLKKRMQKGLKPDFGPTKTHFRLGASCLAVRDFMGAFNINLATEDLAMAKQLASLLRQKRKDDSYQKLDLSEVKFMAWYIPQYQCCQISTNIYNLRKVTLLSLYNLVDLEASQLGINLYGSELIGMIPLKGICDNVEELDKAIRELKLDSVRPFNKEDQVLEYKIGDLLWSS